MSVKIRFVDRSGLLSKAIKLWTWSDISHVEFVFPDGYLGADFPDGVKVRPFNYCNPTKEWFGVIECTDTQAKQVEAFARAQIGKPYSVLGILGFIVKHDFNKQGSWFCSELVYAAFQAAGIKLLNISDIDRISPVDVFESALVQIQGETK